MSCQRRKCRLANTEYSNIDLRNYEKIIVKTVDNVVPGKNPRVYKEYFSTDPLNQSESVTLGRALAKLEDLNALGKTITIFRLFDGNVYDSEESTQPSKRIKKQQITRKPKGGRLS